MCDYTMNYTQGECYIVKMTVYSRSMHHSLVGCPNALKVYRSQPEKFEHPSFKPFFTVAAESGRGLENMYSLYCTFSDCHSTHSPSAQDI